MMAKNDDIKSSQDSKKMTMGSSKGIEAAKAIESNELLEKSYEMRRVAERLARR